MSAPPSVPRITSCVDARTRTLQTEVEIPNPGLRLRPGMYARVTLTLEVHEDALTIPTEAVMGKDEDRFVYTAGGGVAKKTPVKVGVDDGKTAEITEGLSPDSQVVVDGRESLVDGAPVKAEPMKAAAPPSGNGGAGSPAAPGGPREPAAPSSSSSGAPPSATPGRDAAATTAPAAPGPRSTVTPFPEGTPGTHPLSPGRAMK
jgi:membrane fusion protein (multidrug efflux system)